MTRLQGRAKRMKETQMKKKDKRYKSRKEGKGFKRVRENVKEEEND